MDVIEEHFDIILKNANELCCHIKDSNIRKLSNLDRNNYKLVCYTIICIGECFSRFIPKEMLVFNDDSYKTIIKNVRNWKFLRNKLVHQFDTFRPDKYWKTNLELIDEIKKLVYDINYVRNIDEHSAFENKKRKRDNMRYN